MREELIVFTVVVLVLMKKFENPYILMLGWIGLCYNKSVLTITKLDIMIIIKYPMAAWDYGFGN